MDLVITILGWIALGVISAYLLAQYCVKLTFNRL